MNDQGLCFDTTAMTPTELPPAPGKAIFRGHLLDKVLRECATVVEARRLLDRYHWPVLGRCQVLICDRSGDSAIIGPTGVLPRRDVCQTIPNPELAPLEVRSGTPALNRYNTATRLLRAQAKPTIASMVQVLTATHQSELFPTQYSCVYDLKSGEIYVYHFRNPERIKKFSLKRETSKGDRTLVLGELYSDNPAFKAFSKAYETRMLAQRGPEWKPQAAAAAKLLIQYSDRDAGGDLSRDELPDFVCFSPTDAQDALSRFDVNRDGRLNEEELTELLQEWFPLGSAAL